VHYVVGEAVDMTQKSRKEKAVEGEQHRRLKRVKKTQKKKKKLVFLKSVGEERNSLIIFVTRNFQKAF